MHSSLLGQSIQKRDLLRTLVRDRQDPWPSIIDVLESEGETGYAFRVPFARQLATDGLLAELCRGAAIMCQAAEIEPDEALARVDPFGPLWHQLPPPSRNASAAVSLWHSAESGRPIVRRVYSLASDPGNTRRVVTYAEEDVAVPGDAVPRILALTLGVARECAACGVLHLPALVQCPECRSELPLVFTIVCPHCAVRQRLVALCCASCQIDISEPHSWIAVTRDRVEALARRRRRHLVKQHKRAQAEQRVRDRARAKAKAAKRARGAAGPPSPGLVPLVNGVAPDPDVPGLSSASPSSAAVGAPLPVSVSLSTDLPLRAFDPRRPLRVSSPAVSAALLANRLPVEPAVGRQSLAASVGAPSAPPSLQLHDDGDSESPTFMLSAPPISVDLDLELSLIEDAHTTHGVNGQRRTGSLRASSGRASSQVVAGASEVLETGATNAATRATHMFMHQPPHMHIVIQRGRLPVRLRGEDYIFLMGCLSNSLGSLLNIPTFSLLPTCLEKLVGRLFLIELVEHVRDDVVEYVVPRMPKSAVPELNPECDPMGVPPVKWRSTGGWRSIANDASVQVSFRARSDNIVSYIRVRKSSHPQRVLIHVYRGRRHPKANESLARFVPRRLEPFALYPPRLLAPHQYLEDGE
ncbi:uncharacterized protein AMSG_08356 [Thecamonas trahens ATCC 50062]|uniref:Uncharacterized protein n=1 Tax=Thecamonas trahens ATCC 50062 TaxID=461836 RepID=A0A0L0DJ07_THETB|nr:hypothetical protein AMSG_08356 [Thecamonas trahens ATCC 50062]KNC52384.1 hypothetical protein AMSG_08356 [Thecamonas trahens ATCC 50062]|eukprot:XP_013755429.1 hypothetical protein AMSG_08356 [Thecamonas trahens ATCC 50062]